MLTDNKLLIDQDCPMCSIYGNLFVSKRLIADNSLLPYQLISDADSRYINMTRAKTEIALHDTANKQTVYGIDSIFKILAGDNQLIASILNLPIIHFPASILYSFISYNRKVIYPTQASETGLRSCNPAVNKYYSWAYILLVALFTAVVVNSFTFYLFTNLGWAHNIQTELLVCFGQILWQGTVALQLSKKKTLTYLGNMSTVSLLGAFLLLPLLVIAKLFTLPTYLLLVYFTLVIGFMFFKHLKRCALLGMGKVMTASWVAYRTVALGLILLSLGILNF